jgi:hypothetical protein
VTRLRPTSVFASFDVTSRRGKCWMLEARGDCAAGRGADGAAHRPHQSGADGAAHRPYQNRPQTASLRYKWCAPRWFPECPEIYRRIAGNFPDARRSGRQLFCRLV